MNPQNTMDNQKSNTWNTTKLPCDDGCFVDDATDRANDDCKQVIINRSDETILSIKADSVLSLEQKLDAMEQNRKRMEEELDMQMELKRKEMEFRKEIGRKRMTLERQLREREEEEEMLLQNEILLDRKCQLNRMRASQNSFLIKLKSVDDEIAKLKTKKKNFDSSSESSLKSSSSSVANARKKSLSSKSKFNNLAQYGLEQQRCLPTKTQLAARNGICSELPTFTGKPEEWPLFYGMYQASNEACGYTDVENLVRLQDCLKGPALEMVRGLLMLPKSVPRVIEKLRQLYGRPEQLLQSHLQKIRNLAPPRSNNLASFIPFGTVVEQLCEHLEAADMEQHLLNPLLVQELVDKLPDNDKREWVRFKRRNQIVTLRTFTDFISEIVSEACEANVEYNTMNDFQLDDEPKRTGSLDMTGARNNDSEDESLEADEEWKDCKPCEVNEAFLQTMRDGAGTSMHATTNSNVLLRMIPVKLHYGGKSISTLALLDEGSSVTLVERKLAERLGAHGVHEDLKIQWTAGIDRLERDSRRMSLWVSGDKTDEKLLLKSVHTVDLLKLPEQTLNAERLLHQYEYLREIPVSSYSGRPEILIGVNNIHSCAPIDSRIRGAAEPIAVKSKLGWAVYGPRQEVSAIRNNYLGFHKKVANENAKEEINEFNRKHKIAKERDQERMYHTREKGHYIVEGRAKSKLSQVHCNKVYDSKNHEIVIGKTGAESEGDSKSRKSLITGCYGLEYVTTPLDSTTRPTGDQNSNGKSVLYTQMSKTKINLEMREQLKAKSTKKFCRI